MCVCVRVYVCLCAKARFAAFGVELLEIYIHIDAGSAASQLLVQQGKGENYAVMKRGMCVG